MVANDNGDVISHTVQRSAGLANPSTVLTQKFCCHDPANRLSLASETGGWAQNYNYDAFGNRAVAAGSYVPNEGFTPSGTVASVFPASNNRLVRGAGDVYDGAGNQTAWATVPASASGSWFTYDGENRLLTANVANQGGASFVYDGEGRRVQKTAASGAVTTYVHDATGNLAAEYSTAAPAAAGTQYLTSDFLGQHAADHGRVGQPGALYRLPAVRRGDSGGRERTQRLLRDDGQPAVSVAPGRGRPEVHRQRTGRRNGVGLFRLAIFPARKGDSRALTSFHGGAINTVRRMKKRRNSKTSLPIPRTGICIPTFSTIR